MFHSWQDKKNIRKFAYGNGWCSLNRRLLAFLVSSVMLAGCATPHPAVDPTQVDSFFPLLESDAKSFKTIALAASPPELSGTNHVAWSGAGSSGMAGLGNLPPALGAAFLLLQVVGAQAQATDANASIDAHARLTRFQQLVEPIAASTIDDLTLSLGSMGYAVTRSERLPSYQRGSGEKLEAFNQRRMSFIKDRLKTHDAVLTLSHDYEFIRAEKTPTFVPFVVASLTLYRLDASGRLLMNHSSARSRSRLRAWEGTSGGPFFERSDFEANSPQSLASIRDALEKEFAAANAAFLSDFSLPDEADVPK